MKPWIMALGLGALGVLTIQAEPVTEITGGSISRSYSFLGHQFLGETDDLTLFGSIGGVDFRILSFNMTDSFPFYRPVTTFTDHVSAGVFLFMKCPGCDPIPGDLSLDVQSFLSGTSGIFSASGSFTASSSLNIPLTGGGTTQVGFYQFYDPDPGYFYYDPAGVSYNFVPAPEPAVMISTGLGLLALLLFGRRRLALALDPGRFACPDVKMPGTDSLKWDFRK